MRGWPRRPRRAPPAFDARLRHRRRVDDGGRRPSLGGRRGGLGRRRRLQLTDAPEAEGISPSSFTRSDMPTHRQRAATRAARPRQRTSARAARREIIPAAAPESGESQSWMREAGSRRRDGTRSGRCARRSPPATPTARRRGRRPSRRRRCRPPSGGNRRAGRRLRFRSAAGRLAAIHAPRLDQP